MNRLFRLAAVVSLLMPSALAQDPLKTLPQASQLEFENKWVKVTRVHYGPREKIPAHDHTAMASAYVYLNDSGPVIFKHINLPYGAVTRPATKTGSFRLYRGLKEIHEVENLSDSPSDFLRVEFKTEPRGVESLRGRFYREDYPAGENYRKVQFENEQVRITRLITAPGKELSLSAKQAESLLIIALTSSRLTASDQKGKTASVNLEPGQIRWLAGGAREQLKNLNHAPSEMLCFEFKTKPMADPNGNTKAHDHQHK
jgi:hypothetical protein